MDSVFVGPAERQVVAFQDQNGNDIFIDELLSWVEGFTNDQAPNLVKEAGKRGAAAIIPTGQLLANLVCQFKDQVGKPDSNLPAGLRHPRVLPPLRELDTYLRSVVDLAQNINQPVPTS
jgi:hypothetical protein